MQLNPSVSVRIKGVMEKCNFCIQRVRETRELAKDKNTNVKDGEIKTACQQSCPTKAIYFGDAKDPNSEVSRIKNQSRRAYKQMEEINYQPAVTYLKKVTHDNKKA